MNPTLKYTLGRLGIFIACLALLYVPRDLNVLLKLLIALLVSAIASYFFLRPWANEVAEQMSASSRRRMEEKERLRAALAGDDEPPATPPADGDRRPD